jgi:hypothetical protein
VRALSDVRDPFSVEHSDQWAASVDVQEYLGLASSILFAVKEAAARGLWTVDDGILMEPPPSVMSASVSADPLLDTTLSTSTDSADTQPLLDVPAKGGIPDSKVACVVENTERSVKGGNSRRHRHKRRLMYVRFHGT